MKSPTRLDPEKRQGLYLARLREGATPTAAATELVISDDLIRQWRSRYPTFATQERDLINGLARHGGARRDHTTIDWTEFRRRYFGQSHPTHMQRIIDTIEASARVGNKNLTLILLPPQHAKTTIVNQYAMARIAHDKNLRICIASVTTPIARKRIQQIGRILKDESHPLTQDFGPFFVKGQERDGYPWNADMVRVWGADRNNVDPTLESVGINGSIIGSRLNMLIADDLQDVKHLDQTEQILHAFRQDFLSRVLPEGCVVIIANRVGENDVYEALIDEGLVDNLLLMPVMDQDGNALWPEQFTPDRLAKERKNAGPVAWANNWMMEPLSDERTFSAELIAQALDISMTQSSGSSLPRLVAVDPAISGPAAFLAASYSADRLNIHDLEIVDNPQRTENLLWRLDQMVRKHEPRVVIIENGSMGTSLARDDRMLSLAAKYGFTIHMHTTAGEKFHPDYGVASMDTSFADGSLRIADGDELSRRALEPLRGQLARWRPLTQRRAAGQHRRDLAEDAVMALWFAWKFWRERRNLDYGHMSGHGFKGRGTPFSPTGYFRPQKRSA